jgi:peroxiredoxin
MSVGNDSLENKDKSYYPMSEKDFPLPRDLPRPVDDGTASHLLDTRLPRISLPSTKGRMIDLASRAAERVVVYCYPMTGVPGRTLPEGWDSIPGARGCTPQTCGFRDFHQEFVTRNAEVFGLSTQSTVYQKEMSDRLELPFEILSDAEYKFCDALRLPTFEIEGMRLIKRITLIIRAGRIEQVFYPVFPPDASAAETLRGLAQHSGIAG